MRGEPENRFSFSRVALSASRHKDQGPISISRGVTCAIAAGLLPCVVLLLAMGYDFGREHFLLSILPTLFFVALIWLTARNLLVAFLSPGSQRPFHGWKRALPIASQQPSKISEHKAVGFLVIRIANNGKLQYEKRIDEAAHFCLSALFRESKAIGVCSSLLPFEAFAWGHDETGAFSDGS